MWQLVDQKFTNLAPGNSLRLNFSPSSVLKRVDEAAEVSSVWLLHALRLNKAIATKQRQLRWVFGLVMECAIRRGFVVFVTLGGYSFPLLFVGVQNRCRTDDTGLMAEKCELVGNVFCDKFLRDFVKWPTLCWTVTLMHQDWMCGEVPICTFAGMKFGR